MALWSGSVLVALGIVVISVIAEPDVRGLRFPGADKVGHAIAYFILADLLLLAGVWRPGRSEAPWKGPLPVIAMVVAYGWFLELLQGMVGRDAQVIDGLADLLGALLALAVWSRARRQFSRWSSSRRRCPASSGRSVT